MASVAVRLILILTLAIPVHMVSAVLLPGWSDIAEAQSQKRRGWNPLSPLLKLFGPPRVRKNKRGLFERKRKQRARQPVKLRKRAVVRVRKNSDARRVLVVGDIYARGLFNGLDMAFAQSPDISIIRESKNDSGLASTSPVDWPGAIGPALENKAADVVVVMIGANDFVGISSETGLIQPENEAWIRAYGLRVQALLNKLAERQIPVFWVGLGPMKDPARSVHASKMSAIFRENVTLAGGVSVDIWDSFTGDDGQYAAQGPDVKGRSALLRLKDGIGFSKAGYRKVAFFVEQELRSRLSSGLRLAAIQAISDEPEVIEVGSIIPLYDSRIGLKVELAGDDFKPASPEADSLHYQLVVAGQSLAPVSGRVDDFGTMRAGRP